MDDQAFTPRTLLGMLRRSDRANRPHLRSQAGIQTALKSAARITRQEPIQLPGKIGTSLVRGKRVNVVQDLGLELVLRKLNLNLRQSPRTRSRTRDDLVRTLCEMLRDSCAYTIYRLDIKSFYESIDARKIVDQTLPRTDLSPTSIRILTNLILWHHAQGGAGLPRGMSVSATLADLEMKDFDQKISRSKEVFYAARFADDIIIIADSAASHTSTISRIRSALPSGLKLNNSKTQFKPVNALSNKVKDKNGALIAEVEYLGYEIGVLNPHANTEGRTIDIDIAPTKVRRLKTRITLSLLAFIKNKDFELLESRIKFLTSNYTILDKNGKFKRPAGIYYNYPLVTKVNNGRLDQLDKFLTSALLSGKGTIFSASKALLSQAQTKRLLKIAFKDGFTSRRMFDFSPDLLSKIQECWKYV